MKDRAYQLRVSFALSAFLWAMLAMAYSCASHAQVSEGDYATGVEVVQEPAPPPRDAQQLVVIATLIAAALRISVFVLRNSKMGAIWDKAPMPTRLAALATLTAGAALADQLASGVDFQTAAMTAIGGLMAAISTHEVQERVMPKKDDA